MFRGDHPEVGRVLGRALRQARDLGHPRIGSEHLLLALTTVDPGDVLAAHGVTTTAVLEAMHHAGPGGAGAAADREALAAIGIHIDITTSRDRPLGREPLLPLGGARARRRAARRRPPLGLDAQAVYEASLRLALARREREHRPEHLALTLLAVDPGIAWLLDVAHVDRAATLAHLATEFPPPQRNLLLRTERRLALRHRRRDIVRRYRATTGRAVTVGLTTALIHG